MSSEASLIWIWGSLIASYMLPGVGRGSMLMALVIAEIATFCIWLAARR